jgi:hypothetical protein
MKRPFTGTPPIHRLEWAAAVVVLAVALWTHRGAAGPWTWFWIIAPDLLGLLPASLLGKAPGKGLLPPRGVPLYNLWHTFLTPLAVGVIVWAITGSVPWALGGWLLHISADRVTGYGLRRADGGIESL